MEVHPRASQVVAAVNWLEIGCPYCPTVLTVPRSAASQTVRCPECGKSYMVPEPKNASSTYDLTTPLPTLPATMDDREFEAMAAAAVSAPAVVKPAAASPPPAPASAPEAPAPQPTPPAPKHPMPPVNLPVPPTSAASPSPQSEASPAAIAEAPTPAVPPESSPPVAPPRARSRRRVTADDLMYPELEKDSPLPEIEILPPPGQRPAHTPEHRASRTAAAMQTENRQAPPPRQDYYGTQTLPGVGPPVGLAPMPGATGDDARTEEIQQRMKRQQMRALINLATFVIGILVMTVFAFIVVRFSRPS